MDHPSDIPAGQAAFGDVAEALDLGMAFQVLATPDGSSRRFVYVSPRCEALNGVPAEAAMADPSTLYDMILPEDREGFIRAELEALAELRAFRMEVRMRRADGEIRWHRIASAPTRLEDGSTLWNGLQTDITEDRRLAEELEDQKRNLEIAVEATQLGLWEIDLRARTMAWSSRNHEIFGLPIDAPVTLDAYMAMIHPEDLERVRAASGAVAESGGDFEVEYRAVVPNGQVRWIHSRGRVVTDEAGPSQIIGTSVDVTARKEAEERKSLVMGELAHRAKNGLQVMMAIVTESARHAETAADLQNVLTERLQAMAASQDLVTASGGRPIQLYDLAAQALTPFGLNRFDIEPVISELVVGGEVAAGLALLLHEMATNAVKYGALSTPKGKVTLSAEHAGPGMISLSWRERGGPEVKPTNRKGFGTRLLQAGLRAQGGKVEPLFEPQGFSARMEFRAAR